MSCSQSWMKASVVKKLNGTFPFNRAGILKQHKYPWMSGDISCLSLTHIVSDFLPLLLCFVIPKCLCFFFTLQIFPSIPYSHPIFLSSPACLSCCSPSSSVHCVLLCMYSMCIERGWGQEDRRASCSHCLLSAFLICRRADQSFFFILLNAPVEMW